MGRVKNSLIAIGLGVYSLFFLAENSLAQQEIQPPREYVSERNIVTDPRPIFQTRFFPNIYRDKNNLTKTLLEIDARQKMNFKNLDNPKGILTYPLLEFRFNLF